MKELVIDRIEGNLFVCYDEHDQRKDIPVNSVKGAKEGDVLIRENGVYRIDKALTEERRKKIIQLQNELWED